MKLTIVVPAYNEEGNIGRLIDSLVALREKEMWDCEILIADDNSKDSTGKIADEYSTKFPNITVLHRKKGDNGMGYALIEGSNMASGEVIVWVMGDCSDNLETVPVMVKKIVEGYDMVIGSRYMKGGSRGELGADKAFLGQLYTTTCRLIFGIPVHDMTNAFRAFRKNVFEKVKPVSGDFAISPEFSIRTHMNGFKVTEAPTTYYNRRAGKANFKILKMGLRYGSLFKYRFQK